ncbi:MAG TPA: glycosyltransferase [Vicinamibacterales bacterium]|nr:glycosyltransferase [Vicinamibacterales bacterium]
MIARALVQALADTGHRPSLVVTPDFGFGRTFATYRSNRRAAVGPVDCVISLRYPSYAVRHPAHACWLNHTMREYYDLWPRFRATLSPLNAIKEGARRQMIRAADRWLLTHNVSRVAAQSRTIQHRLKIELDVDADVIYPPPPQRPYRCDEYGDFVFAVSRLVPLKRLDLLIRALAEPPALQIAVVIGGDGEALHDLRRLAGELGVESRVTFAGRLTDDQLLAHLASCRAVCYPPFEEDYGFVTAEAFASRKAVVTCTDSGGPAELVRHNENGLVVDPTPAALAEAMARMMEDKSLAERMGSEAAADASAMSWHDAVNGLLERALARA